MGNGIHIYETERKKMNISPINALSRENNFNVKNNCKSNYIALKEDKSDTFTPSFKAAKMANIVKGNGKGLALGAMLGLAALFGCQKEEPEVNNIINSGEAGTEICGCVPIDYTELMLESYLEQFDKNDTYGRTAFTNWYNENCTKEIIDPECCRHAIPADPEWETKCQEWIDNYHNGEEICE